MNLKRKNSKNQKGITLIALIITIIVMLILVGVTVTVALNGGLFSTAKSATSQTEAERDNELALSDGKVVINGEKYNSIDEYVNGGSTNNPDEPAEPENPTTPSEPTEYTAYAIGDEVTIGTEKFFVIEESDKTQSTVTLIAKYNLNTAGTAQVNASYRDTACEFSSTSYWPDSQGEEGGPLILNDYPIPENVTSIITTAKAYGTELGGTGRLPTNDDVMPLLMMLAPPDYIEPMYDWIVKGTGYGTTDGALYYWLGEAVDSERLYRVEGSSSYAIVDDYIYDPEDVEFEVYEDCSYSNRYGIRPVVVISKDLIS